MNNNIEEARLGRRERTNVSNIVNDFKVICIEIELKTHNSQPDVLKCKKTIVCRLQLSLLCVFLYF